ncbi:Bifunctional DNA primase/polymerase, N-terminal [Streptoalloteichus tenebrarius]|uniref:Bifunctional DNA primase/polymerase, N-terminal n=1 Tax=Streptoalloteichus tenebrarius (strain ATCC 17920 / DSM 40477 / JCM 4838 / CBS 697.72 / NBRC 16177 / NCIMB 11028 / NRRL B-12390 / A12253. 1 / ISP 5477) TaxID=1933 RepID=A0ABT1HPN1_STRSD|nr:bifunctional DNA primase/polymerase [Streptoalloteichus tenebrarius]MCP2257468.1 Bifunctional DNA primase/polymerase, N-terminal [Streptoalloteichus tenebrarius]
MTSLHPMPGLALTEARDAVVAYASHRWPIVPGDPTFLPVVRPCGSSPSLSVTQALESWTHAPYPILLPCGQGIDAAEIPAGDTHRVVHALRESGALGPIILTRHGSWLLLVSSGPPLHPSLGVRVLGAGSWVVLPPTKQYGHPCRWRVSPQAVDWAIPPRDLLQDALFRAWRAPVPTEHQRSRSL